MVLQLAAHFNIVYKIGRSYGGKKGVVSRSAAYHDNRTRTAFRGCIGLGLFLQVRERYLGPRRSP